MSETKTIDLILASVFNAGFAFAKGEPSLSDTPILDAKKQLLEAIERANRGRISENNDYFNSEDRAYNRGLDDYDRNLRLELTLDKQNVIDSFLEDYKRNPSNSNKHRYGLQAWIEDWAKQAILEAIDRARPLVEYENTLIHKAQVTAIVEYENNLKRYLGLDPEE